MLLLRALGVIVSIIHHLGDGRVMEDSIIMGTTCPTCKDVSEAAPVVDDTLQHNIEEALAVDELLSSLV